MASKACASCGETFPESQLLFSGKGQICGACEMDVEERSARSSNVWATVLTGPFAVIGGTITLCVPLLGGVISLGMAVVGLYQATVALQAYKQANSEPNYNPTHKVLLLVSGVVTLLWALVLFLLVAITLVVTLAMSLQ